RQDHKSITPQTRRVSRVLQPATAMSRRIQAVAEPSRPSAARERQSRERPPRSRRERARRPSRRPLFGLAALPVVAVAALILFELGNWDKITPGVSALGTSVGGLSKPDAVAQLKPGVGQVLDRPLDISATEAGPTWHTTARDLGLRLDPDELANAAY